MGTQTVEADFYIVSDGGPAVAGGYTDREALNVFDRLVAMLERAEQDAQVTVSVTVRRPLQEPRRLGVWVGVPVEVIAELQIARIGFVEDR